MIRVFCVHLLARVSLIRPSISPLFVSHLQRVIIIQGDFLARCNWDDLDIYVDLLEHGFPYLELYGTYDYDDADDNIY